MQLSERHFLPQLTIGSFPSLCFHNYATIFLHTAFYFFTDRFICSQIVVFSSQNGFFFIDRLCLFITSVGFAIFPPQVLLYKCSNLCVSDFSHVWRHPSYVKGKRSVVSPLWNPSHFPTQVVELILNHPSIHVGTYISTHVRAVAVTCVCSCDCYVHSYVHLACNFVYDISESRVCMDFLLS